VDDLGLTNLFDNEVHDVFNVVTVTFRVRAFWLDAERPLRVFKILCLCKDLFCILLKELLSLHFCLIWRRITYWTQRGQRNLYLILKLIIHTHLGHKRSLLNLRDHFLSLNESLVACHIFLELPLGDVSGLGLVLLAEHLVHHDRVGRFSLVFLHFFDFLFFLILLGFFAQYLFLGASAWLNGFGFFMAAEVGKGHGRMARGGLVVEELRDLHGDGVLESLKLLTLEARVLEGEKGSLVEAFH